MSHCFFGSYSLTYIQDDGMYVMYYSAGHIRTPRKHCVGVATSPSPRGPFISESEPFACPLAQGGAIDPAGFQDSDGKRYVVYKVDGNSMGHGGNCKNTVPPIVATPLLLQEVKADGITQVGEPVELLDRTEHDGPLIEGPDLIKTQDGIYFLFFSSNCFTTLFYDVSYATSTNLTGPYTRAKKPLLVTGDYGLKAPGGIDLSPDAKLAVFHGDCPWGRCMYQRELRFHGTEVHT
jgi:beta-xylosidase